MVAKWLCERAQKARGRARLWYLSALLVLLLSENLTFADSLDEFRQTPMRLPKEEVVWPVIAEALEHRHAKGLSQYERDILCHLVYLQWLAAGGKG